MSLSSQNRERNRALRKIWVFTNYAGLDEDELLVMVNRRIAPPVYSLRDLSDDDLNTVLQWLESWAEIQLARIVWGAVDAEYEMVKDDGIVVHPEMNNSREEMKEYRQKIRDIQDRHSDILRALKDD